MNFIWILIALCVGSILGLITASLCFASGNADRETDRMMHIDMIFELFNQACRRDTADGFYYNHDCISTYEEAQQFLIGEGVIREEECTFE